MSNFNIKAPELDSIIKQCSLKDVSSGGTDPNQITYQASRLAIPPSNLTFSSVILKFLQQLGPAAETSVSPVTDITRFFSGVLPVAHPDTAGAVGEQLAPMLNYFNILQFLTDEEFALERETSRRGDQLTWLSPPNFSRLWHMLSSSSDMVAVLIEAR